MCTREPSNPLTQPNSTLIFAQHNHVRAQSEPTHSNLLIFSSDNEFEILNPRTRKSNPLICHTIFCFFLFINYLT